MPPLDISHPQPIDQGALQHLTPAAPDCSFAREVQTQVANLAQPMPGAESMLGAPGVPGAEQAISPLIQMIMKMPGHIGLAGSFFEALGSFFFPQNDMLSLFDPSNFGLHIDLSSALPHDGGGDIDFSILPADAPLLDHLAGSDMGTAGTLDLASDKLNLSLGGHSHFVSDNGSTSLSMGSQLNVSGSASLAKPQFEGAGGLVSGPNLSENFQANSLAANNRLFSDGAGIANANQTMLAAGNNSVTSASSAVNSTVAGNTTVLSNTPAGISDNVSAHGSSANNVSYNVFEKLAGNKDILAANNVPDAYHSTIGTIQPDAAMDNVAKSAANSHSPATTGGDLGGLKAKPMTMDGLKVDGPKLEMKADHVQAAHQNAAADHVKAESIKVDHTKVEHIKVQASKPIEHAAAAVKPAHAVSHVNQVNHTAQAASVKPTMHSPAHSAVRPEQIAQKVVPQATPAEGQFNVAADNVQAQAQAQAAAPAEANQEFGAPDNNGAGVGADANAANAQTGDINQANGDAAQGGDANGNQTLEKTAPIAKTYTIRSGDCLWNIAKDNLGDATKWSDIYKMNSDVLGTNPSLIHPGTSIQLPGADGAAASGGIAHYTVKPGDNLWDIAKNQMGDATKWGDLYKANQDIIGSNPDLIRPGQELTIDTGAADPASSQLSSAGTNAGSTTGTNLAQAPAAHGAAAPSQAGGELAQNTAGKDIPGINTYGDGGVPQTTVQSSSAVEFDAAPMGQNIQPPQAPVMTGAKVMPVEAQPDIILQPAHAADLHTAAMPAEAANAANSLAQGQKSMVNTSAGADVMSFLSRRR